jgi:putative aldouronate transport system permease protein
MISYIPYFISVVVAVGLLFQIFALRTGLLNNIIEMLGGTRVDFLSNPGTFRNLYVWSGVWQTAGWGSIIYIASLSSVDPQLHEAAIIDGATILERIRHVDLPAIMPTIVVMLILNMGQILSTGFEKVLLMQNPVNMGSSEVIDTFVFKIGIAGQFPDYGYSSAVGMFQSVVTFILILTVNKLTSRLSKNSLW